MAIDPVTATMVAGVASAGASAGNGIISAFMPRIQDKWNKKAEQRAVQYQKDAEAREQEYIISSEQRANAEYDRRLADQRAYDDPSAMVARYKQAGLNPASISGNITSQPISTNAVNAPSADAPGAIPPDVSGMHIPNVVSSYQDAQLKAAQIENIAADTESKRAGTERTFEEIVGIKAANRIKAVEADVAEATKSDKIELSAKAVEQAEETVAHLREERNNMVKDGLLKDKELEIFDKKLEELDSIIALNKAITALRENDVKVGEAQIEHWKNQDALAKEDFERLRNQGLAGLRLQAAELGLDKNKFDWDKERVAIEQELKQQGLNIDWSKLGQTALSAIATALAIYYTGGAAATAKGAAKIVTNIVRKVPFKK